MRCLPRGVVGNHHFLVLLLLIACLPLPAQAQLETATVSGQVVDPSGLSVAGGQVKLVDIDRDTTAGTATNASGLYTFQSVKPGRYRMEVSAAGFRVVNVTGLTVNVQDHLEQNIKLTVGSVSQSVTVEGGAPLVDTETATVSTVVDRNFAENLPMNGRSFQTLIQLTPGVVLTPALDQDGGQFSVNGQRAASNYWMVDGVSANIGTTANDSHGNGFAGALGGFSAQGGTNGLVSVDALQEFRIQTSTYAPEFGRTPGGQISIVTRSGTNLFHGTLFDYLRNDVLDANDWFNGYTNTPPLPKAEERQNDFGGTFSGPILKDKTFFFFSYEGLRLRLPQTALTTVPDVQSRQDAIPVMQPFFDAFPLPNGPEVTDSQGSPTGAAQFNASYSNASTLDAYSLRIDHRLSDKITLFARYNYSPSDNSQREGTLSTISSARIKIQTGTAGATWMISPLGTNDLRFNYSKTDAGGHDALDTFGGAVPLASLPFPSPYTSQNALFSFEVTSLQGQGFNVGPAVQNTQRQINLVDNLSLQHASHSIKVGIDFRRLSPTSSPYLYVQNPIFSDVTAAETGDLEYSFVQSKRSTPLLFRNLGIFAQDTWRVFPPLTLTYGLRWDVDFAPLTTSGPGLTAAIGFDTNNLANLALAPAGTPSFVTPYGSLAPRLGVAYQLSQKRDWSTVLRGGFGVFYDLAGGEVGNTYLDGAYPFAGGSFAIGGEFPLSPATAAPPAISPPNATQGTLAAFDPHLKLPYSLEWNVALEQALGPQQTVSASYIGSAGRRLIQSAVITAPNHNLAAADLVGNFATSDYDALQLQFRRRLSHGLQAIASYTWSHSLDTASSGSYYDGSNAFVPSQATNINRGPSDFDIRNALSAGVTYDIPAARTNNSTATSILRGWSVENVIQARSAPPVDIYNLNYYTLDDGAVTNVRPDIVPGIPLYLYGQEYPGGKIFNNTPNQGGPACTGPFCSPPIDPNTGGPLRQGDLGRNALRGFGAAQWDYAIRRDFPIHETLKVQFRAEMFNVLNHPNFAPPVGDLSGNSGLFGFSNQTLGQYLSGQNVGGGGFSPLYQIGGPRSIQFALKVDF
jgi:hypothetical protein